MAYVFWLVYASVFSLKYITRVPLSFCYNTFNNVLNLMQSFDGNRLIYVKEQIILSYSPHASISTLPWAFNVPSTRSTSVWDSFQKYKISYWVFALVNPDKYSEAILLYSFKDFCLLLSLLPLFLVFSKLCGNIDYRCSWAIFLWHYCVFKKTHSYCFHGSRMNKG